MSEKRTSLFFKPLFKNIRICQIFSNTYPKLRNLRRAEIDLCQININDLHSGIKKTPDSLSAASRFQIKLKRRLA